METKFYPLQFYPIFKERIWGGTKLKTVLNKNTTSNNIGESWELSTVPGDISKIKQGIWEGKLFTELIEEYPNEILGTVVHQKFGKQFPPLFKYLDAKEDLSIQVHPNDDLAQKRHNSFGKTEMWYVMQADPDARIIVGFKENSNQEEYLAHLKQNTLLDLLEEIKVQQGDAFFLETGTVHAIGKGMVVAEIQQTSDITYRLYDFDRKDTAGNTRELHVDLALDAINFNKVDSYRTYKNEENKSNAIVKCPYFTTNSLPLRGQKEISKNKDSFLVYMCVDGAFQIEIDSKKYSFQKGETVFIPAVISNYLLLGNATLLEIYISY